VRGKERVVALLQRLQQPLCGCSAAQGVGCCPSAPAMHERKEHGARQTARRPPAAAPLAAPAQGNAGWRSIQNTPPGPLTASVFLLTLSIMMASAGRWLLPSTAHDGDVCCAGKPGPGCRLQAAPLLLPVDSPCPHTHTLPAPGAAAGPGHPTQQQQHSSSTQQQQHAAAARSSRTQQHTCSSPSSLDSPNCRSMSLYSSSFRSISDGLA